MKTILVVDDELSIAETLSGVLEDEGYRVLLAGNGKEGLERLEAERPDLVITDVMMPLLDGREVVRAIRADPRFASTPVILMSAATGIVAGQAIGHDAFLQKPFSLDVVIDLVKSLLERGRAE